MPNRHTRPDAPQADSFQMFCCDDPDCGAHLVGIDSDGKPLCEIVLGRKYLQSFIKALQDLAYNKAVEKF